MYPESDRPLTAVLLIILTGFVLVTGCGRNEAEDPNRIVLQTDWFAQPEHGGFYQALATGLYKEAGLDVIILPGGPNAMSTQKVLKGDAHFAMNRADTIHALASRGVPVQLVMATLQHDPQAIMVHASSDVTSLEMLDGRQVMAVPGLTWIKWLEAKFGIGIDVIPHDFGMERFLADPGFIQQCMLTNEPYYVERAGAEIRVLPLAESGFDPYHGIYCLADYAAAHPEQVRKFIAASIAGWQDFMFGDPSPAFEHIARANPKMDPGFLTFGHAKLLEWRLVSGRSGDAGQVGQLDSTRLESMAGELQRLGLAGEEDGQTTWYTTDYLPVPE